MNEKRVDADRPLVMIVDDQADALEMHTAYLSASGFDTCGTSTALYAIEMAVTRRPDAILTDVSMPVVDGWTILRTLKEHPLTAQTPIVLLTGDADAMRGPRADPRCDAFLTKPCPPETIVETLRAVLGASALRSATVPEDEVSSRLTADPNTDKTRYNPGRKVEQPPSNHSQ